MSERVNRIVFNKKKDSTKEELMTLVYKQINILIEAGYNCFISSLESNNERICLEFCIADQTFKDKDVPQPCWLYLEELEYLGKYQLENMLDEARKAVIGIQEELEQAAEEQEEKPVRKRHTKKKDFDA